MQNFKLFTRMNLIILLLILQMAAIFVFAWWLVHAFPFIYWCGVFLSVLAFSYILKKDEASVYKITWLLIILVVPSAGGVLYMIFGNKHSLTKIIAHTNEHAIITKILDADGNLPFINEVKCGRMFSLLNYIRSASGYHTYKNTETKYYSQGTQMFTDMLSEIARAEKFIFIEFFIIKYGKMWEQLLDALAKKTAEGVEVRLIVDHLGSHKLFTGAYVKTIREKGIRVLRFNPMMPFLLMFMNNRDHRKILVIDGKTAFTGGINIADEYINLKQPYGIWKDTGIRMRGDAVWSLSLMFIEMWNTFCKDDEHIYNYDSYKDESEYKTDGFVIPYGDTPLDNELLGENIYADILTQARNYVYIFTPYLIISEKLISILQLTAKRGIDVRIVTPGIPDKKLVYRLTRSYYRYMLDAGVKIYEYTPGFLHAKGIVCDNHTAVVGTINFDYRSLYLHFECAVLLYNCSAIKDIRDDVLQTIEESREVINTEKWRIGTDLLDAVLHLFAPLM